MKRADSRPLPSHDYALALKNAVNWLGERYLLAEPARRLTEETGSFYAVPRRWHDVAQRRGR